MPRFTKDNTKLINNGDGTYELVAINGANKGDTLGLIIPMELALIYIYGAADLPEKGWAWLCHKNGHPQHAPTRSGAAEALRGACEEL